MKTRPGSTFQATDVVALYRHRPPYAPAALTYVEENAPVCNRLLDLGCGSGRIACHLAATFDEVTAVDPSTAMVAMGRTSSGGDAPNLTWVTSTAEDAPLVGSYDVVTFASSIHWMDPTRLFAKLRPHLQPHHMLAMIDGDMPFAPPWQADWETFLIKWVPVMSGQPYGSDYWHGLRSRHRPFVDLVDTVETLSDPISQSVPDFILSQHARETFAPERMGTHREAFDAELAELLHPHRGSDGLLSYRVKTTVTHATARKTALSN
ncbi:MAG: class I SAM-dependent methyltransferase [Pseudomonadota bacterium]